MTAVELSALAIETTVETVTTLGVPCHVAAIAIRSHQAGVASKRALLVHTRPPTPYAGAMQAAKHNQAYAAADAKAQLPRALPTPALQLPGPPFAVNQYMHR